MVGIGGAWTAPTAPFGRRTGDDRPRSTSYILPSPIDRRRFRDFDLTVDLGAGVGSAGWFRGLATLGLMIGALTRFAPGIVPLPRLHPLVQPAGASEITIALANDETPANRQSESAILSIPLDDPTPNNAPLRLSGMIGADLYRTAAAGGAPASAVADYLRAVDGRIAKGKVAPHDRYDMVVDQHPTKNAKLVYAGLIHDGKPIRLLRWTLDRREQWFDASGTGETSQRFTMPVDGRRTSAFGMRRHPLLGYSRMHQGVDFGAPRGTPIVAASGGTVSYAGWHGGHGKFVQIRHAGGIGTGYGHMSRMVVRVGEAVEQGQLIGYVGSTGLSTGPHLHFEVYANGAPVRPAASRFATTAKLSGKELDRFKAAFLTMTAPIAPKPAGPARMAETKAPGRLNRKG